MEKFLTKQSIKKIIGLFLAIGIPQLAFIDFKISNWIIILDIFIAFLSAGLMANFKDFKNHIKGLDGKKGNPEINQTWALFLICLIFNLIMSILIIFYGSTN